MNDAELPITGYLDRFSHRPGERFSAHVSVRDGTQYRARLVRVISGDPNPAGPGMRIEDQSRHLDQTLSGRRQSIRLGSLGMAPAPASDASGPRTWTALIWFAAVGERRAVLSQSNGGMTVVLAAGASGTHAKLAWPGGEAEIATGAPLQARRWYRVWVSADPASGRLQVGHCETQDGMHIVAETHAMAMRLPGGGTAMIAAEHAAEPRSHFTGKIEDPAILGGFLSPPFAPLARPAELGQVLAAWDFSVGIGTQSITDTGPQSRHGTLVNVPTRAVVGARWSGREMCWRHAPADYAAIHFHDDDLDDCGWDVDFEWAVPANLRSGAYAIHLTCDAGEDWLPLYVLPNAAGPFAPVAFLASTFTYQAYANHARGNSDAAYRERVGSWGAYPHNPDDYPIYSRSTYNRHADNGGFAFSSRRRPILTMRPGLLTFNDPKGSGLRHYPADTHLLAWMEEKGIAFDVVTDEDLDDEGVELLASYRAVLTGSHPEYHTLGSLDALQAYTAQGGRLAYLGGNGFYWRIARDKARPHMIELRRAEGGIRAWAAEPGEYYHATDGEYGGLWRRNRRPPQMLGAVGFTGQGLFEGTHYRRLPASRAAAYAWLFDGVEEETFGDYGLSGGAAAGFELDRADVRLGTPENAVILARSEDPPASFVAVPEELLSHLYTISGEPARDLIRAEIVHVNLPSGGEVFAVGSITFLGSLWRNGFEGPVSRLLENLVRRFSRPNGEKP